MFSGVARWRIQPRQAWTIVAWPDRAAQKWFRRCWSILAAEIYLIRFWKSDDRFVFRCGPIVHFSSSDLEIRTEPECMQFCLGAVALLPSNSDLEIRPARSVGSTWNQSRSERFYSLGFLSRSSCSVIWFGFRAKSEMSRSKCSLAA